MANDFIQDNFIEIPSYLTEGIKEDIATNSIGLACTGCLDFCEVYDECCEYENCMVSCEGACEDCQTSCQKTCQGCQTWCEITNQGCSTTCEVTCQTCLTVQNPAENAVLTISDITTNSCLATITGLDDSVSYVIKLDWYANNVYKGSTYTIGTSSSKSITGLSSGTTYTIRVEVYNDDTREFLDYLQKNFTTLSLPKLPTPTLDTSATVKTGNSISVTINAVTGATTYYARINGGSQQSSSGRTFTFTGLNPNTQYLIEIKVSGSGYEDSDWASYYATTLVAELWFWTNAEINAFNNAGLTTILTYERWNAFVDKIYETSGSDWWISSADGATLTYSVTKMTSANKTLTADRFNSVRYNIGARVTNSIARVYKGDDVLGSYFITLGNKLNEWIQST